MRKIQENKKKIHKKLTTLKIYIKIAIKVANINLLAKIKIKIKIRIKIKIINPIKCSIKIPMLQKAVVVIRMRVVIYFD